MFTAENALKIAQETFDGLVKSETLETAVEATDETILLGKNSVLDSIGFITFLTDYEDRLQLAMDKECYLDFNEIIENNTGKLSLSVGILVQYAVKLVNDES